MFKKNPTQSGSNYDFTYLSYVKNGRSWVIGINKFTNSVLRELMTPVGFCCVQVRFHPLYPDLLASGSLDHEVRLWDAKTAECIGSRDFCNYFAY